MTYLTPAVVRNRIISATAEMFGVTIVQLFHPARRRERTVARTRMVIQWILRHGTSMSYSEIGRVFDQPDHTTAFSAVRTVNNQLRTDELLRRRVEMIAGSAGVTVTLPLLAPVVAAAAG